MTPLNQDCETWLEENCPDIDPRDLGAMADALEQFVRESMRRFPAKPPALYLVKGEHGYVTESTGSEVYFHDKQRFAKRFTDRGRAYRLIVNQGIEDGEVVRLKVKS